MATLTPVADRRHAPRLGPEPSGWKPDALLRPGFPIRIVNMSSHGALVETATRLRPGRVAELQLCETAGDDSRVLVRGRIGRCRVTAIDPIRYEGAIEFDSPLFPARVVTTLAGSGA